MAHFRGTFQGGRGTEASRLGTRKSGLSAHIASWQGAASVQLSEKDGVDWAIVTLAQHHGQGTFRILYDGPVSGDPPKGR